LSSGFTIIIAIVLIVPLQSDDEIIMLDVGQGDAFVVRSGGRTILIDTGNLDIRLLKGLANHGIYHLDSVIITHADSDHCGSLDVLKGVVQVDNICVSAPTFACSCTSCFGLIKAAEDIVGNERLQGLSVGDTLIVGAFTLEVIWPDEFREEGGNADSLSLLLRYGEMSTSDSSGSQYSTSMYSALFCGDAEAEQLTAMIEKGRLGDIDIYKVGHHGSAKALNEELAKILSPEVSLISAGVSNRYGHPTDTTLETLANSGSHIVRTDTSGEVICTLTPESIKLRSFG
jgi:competence protein ComEC